MTKPSPDRPPFPVFKEEKLKQSTGFTAKNKFKNKFSPEVPQTFIIKGSSQTHSAGKRVLHLLKEFKNLAQDPNSDASSSFNKRLQAAFIKTNQLRNKLKRLDRDQELADLRLGCLTTIKTALKELQEASLGVLVLEANDGSSSITLTKSKLILVRENVNAFFNMALTLNSLQPDQVFVKQRQHKDINTIKKMNNIMLILDIIKTDNNQKKLAFLINKFGGEQGNFAEMQHNFLGFSVESVNLLAWDQKLTLNENLYNAAMALNCKDSAQDIYQGLLENSELLENTVTYTDNGILVEKSITKEDIVKFFAFESNNYHSIDDYNAFFQKRPLELTQFLIEGGSLN